MKLLSTWAFFLLLYGYNPFWGVAVCVTFYAYKAWKYLRLHTARYFEGVDARYRFDLMRSFPCNSQVWARRHSYTGPDGTPLNAYCLKRVGGRWYRTRTPEARVVFCKWWSENQREWTGTFRESHLRDMEEDFDPNWKEMDSYEVGQVEVAYQVYLKVVSYP